MFIWVVVHDSKWLAHSVKRKLTRPIFFIYDLGIMVIALNPNKFVFPIFVVGNIKGYKSSPSDGARRDPSPLLSH